MSSISKFRRSILALTIAAALIVIPNADFIIDAAAFGGIRSLAIGYGDETLDYTPSPSEEAKSLSRAEAVDKAKEDAYVKLCEIDVAEEEARRAEEETEARRLAELEAEAQKKATLGGAYEQPTDLPSAANLTVSDGSEQVSSEEATETPTETPTEPQRPAISAPQTSSDFLLAIDEPDPNYSGRAVALTDYDRDILERLVMGEAGNQCFIGMALVAQTIRDRMVYDGYTSVESVRTGCGYYATLGKTPSDDARSAVSYIFDQGGSAVQHTIRYFYAYTWYTSSWHESMNYVVTYGDQKFFDNW